MKNMIYNFVPTIVILFYGSFLITLIVAIFLLLKEDLSKFHKFISIFGVKWLLGSNLENFD
jgi:hypothetical protein